jgi:hypothetical protein
MDALATEDAAGLRRCLEARGGLSRKPSEPCEPIENEPSGCSLVSPKRRESLRLARSYLLKPCGIVWLNRRKWRVDARMETKREYAEHADSQGRFGVHFSIKPGRFGGFRDFGDHFGFR